MAFAAHDALFEEPGAIGGAFHFGVVVGFEGEDVDAAEGVDERVGDVAEVGGETDAVIVAGDEEAVGAGVVVGEMEGLESDIGEGVEGSEIAGIADDEL